MESTYGDRNHRSVKDTADEFAEIVQRASQQGGKILVPTFAVGRALVEGAKTAKTLGEKTIVRASVRVGADSAHTPGRATC